MRVLIVTPDIVGPIKNGGIGTACYHYGRTLADGGMETAILFTGPMQNGRAADWKIIYRKNNIEFLTLEDTSAPQHSVIGTRWHNSCSHRILNFLRNRHFDYIFFQDWHANGFWTIRSKQMGLGFTDTTLGVIVHSPTEWQKEGMETFGAQPLHDAALQWEEREAIAGADVVISPSRHMIQWLTEHHYPLPARIEILPYTFEDEVRLGDPARVDRGHLIFFGRLETRKGLHLLGGALRQMRAEGNQLPRKVSMLGKLGTVGGVASQDYIARLKIDMPEVEYFVESNFDYRGGLDYIQRENGVVIIASLSDNYPLTVIECITNGVCFLAASVGGITEMVSSEILFEPNVISLKNKLNDLESIDFRFLRHLYDPIYARNSWLEHVAQNNNCLSSPNIGPTNSGGVSVCIPYFYHDRYLARLINAFLQMPNEEFQLVIVNDGTPESDCLEFLRMKSRLELLGHVFHIQDNAGAGAARNKAAELARNDLLLFFDADNVPFADIVPKLRQALISSHADSVAAPFYAVPPFNRRPNIEDTLFAYQPPGGPLSSGLIHNVLGDTCGIQRREIFEKIGGFSTNRAYYDDWEYFIKLIGKGYQHYMYPEPLFYYTFDIDGRRSWNTQYKKRKTLLGSLNNIDAPMMKEILSIFVTQILVPPKKARKKTSFSPIQRMGAFKNGSKGGDY